MDFQISGCLYHRKEYTLNMSFKNINNQGSKSDDLVSILKRLSFGPLDKVGIEYNNLFSSIMKIWFRFMECLLILGTVSYLKITTGGLIINVLYYISFVIFFLFLLSFLIRFVSFDENLGTSYRFTLRDKVILFFAFPIFILFLTGIAVF